MAWYAVTMSAESQQEGQASSFLVICLAAEQETLRRRVHDLKANLSQSRAAVEPKLIAVSWLQVAKDTTEAQQSCAGLLCDQSWAAITSVKARHTCFAL